MSSPGRPGFGARGADSGRGRSASPRCPEGSPSAPRRSGSRWWCGPGRPAWRSGSGSGAGARFRGGSPSRAPGRSSSAPTARRATRTLRPACPGRSSRAGPGRPTPSRLRPRPRSIPSPAACSLASTRRARARSTRPGGSCRARAGRGGTSRASAPAFDQSRAWSQCPFRVAIQRSSAAPPRRPVRPRGVNTPVRYTLARPRDSRWACQSHSSRR